MLTSREEVDDVQTVVDAVLADTTEDGHLETRLDAYIKKEVDDVQTVVDAVLADTEADGHLETRLDAYIKKKLMMSKLSLTLF